MRGLLLAAVAACALVVPEASPGPSGRSFTVMTFNIRHGMDGAHQYNLQHAVDVIARIRPDLAGLQEITRNHSMYRCDDQPAAIADGLTRATGRRWYHVYVQTWFVGKDRKCVESGAGDGPNTEGLAFVAPEPIGPVTHLKMRPTRIGLAVRMQAAGGMPVVVTHLDNGSDAKSQRARAAQIEQLLPWAGEQGTPRLIIGDMNAFPDAPALAPVLREYRDAWSDAVSSGTSRGVAGGATRVGRSSRVDYVFFTPAGGLQLEWVEVVDTSRLLGVHASDHHPVVASFRLPSTAQTPSAPAGTPRRR
jgi:endonuclease/exonuclease/phosphatase family metal-dependent hydrolase